jgi:hypothetical protein
MDPGDPTVDRPKAIIAYAQESRMALLKLLALLRWKDQADVPKVVRTVKKADGTKVEERQSDVQTAWVSLWFRVELTNERCVTLLICPSYPSVSRSC